MSRCWGITGSFKTGSFGRCKREGEFKFFCVQHKKQPYWWTFVLIFVIIPGLVSIYSAFLKPSVQNENISKTQIEKRNVWNTGC
jgi:hypothetical protein